MNTRFEIPLCTKYCYLHIIKAGIKMIKFSQAKLYIYLQTQHE